MPTVFILDVEEFRPMIDQAHQMEGVTVLHYPPGYVRVSSDFEISFNRKALGFKPAVWYGALTGGLQGRIAEYSRDTLRIIGENA